MDNKKLAKVLMTVGTGACGLAGIIFIILSITKAYEGNNSLMFGLLFTSLGLILGIISNRIFAKKNEKGEIR